MSQKAWCLHAVGVGEWLEGDGIQPTDIAILITNVFKPIALVHEVLKDIMGECLHSTIRWPRRQIRGMGRVAIENFEEVVRVFDYSKDPPMLQHQTSSSIGPGHSEMDNNEPPIPGFECPTRDGLLGPEVPRRSYQMLQRVAIERHGNRLIGEHRTRKVTLESV